MFLIYLILRPMICQFVKSCVIEAWWPIPWPWFRAKWIWRHCLSQIHCPSSIVTAGKFDSLQDDNWMILVLNSEPLLIWYIITACSEDAQRSGVHSCFHTANRGPRGLKTEAKLRCLPQIWRSRWGRYGRSLLPLGWMTVEDERSTKINKDQQRSTKINNDQDSATWLM